MAAALNGELAAGGSPLPEMLSAKGLRAYFPMRGILGQSAEARNCEINATIGTAFEEDGSALCLECLESMLRLPSHAFLYAPSAGVPELRKAWREMLDLKNPSLRGQKCSLPVVTHALTHALSVAGQLLVDPRDKIILPDLYWDNYELLFDEGCGASLQTFPTFVKGGFNVAAMAKRLLAPGDKKVLLLNFPNNPTGYTATDTEAHAIRDAILHAAEAGKRVVVILDDAYFGLVYAPGVRSESLFPDLAGLHPRVLVVKLDGPTKEDYVWGFRVGFMTFGMQGAEDIHYRALEAKAAGLVRATISSASNIAQQLLLQAYRDPAYAAQKAGKFAILKARYDRIRELLAAHPEYAGAFEPMPFNSGYFMCVRPIGVDAEAVRKRLLTEYGTGTIVLSGLLRLAYSSVPLARLDALFANLYQAIRQVRDASAAPGRPAANNAGGG
ncbi:MAG: aminotransferase class I/II-fold pyridoxal phosphate-dependent enzyme [Kiritimatiellae bacterium]|nr:aminotransferase class I/II-fold pyridoxal phosphate-dependent enzyme [Kiritimatiellia bacterium]